MRPEDIATGRLRRMRPACDRARHAILRRSPSTTAWIGSEPCASFRAMTKPAAWLLALSAAACSGGADKTPTMPAPATAEPAIPAPTPAAPIDPKPAPATPAGGYTGLGADSVAAETIAKFAPKPLDEAVSRRIQSLLDVRGPGSGLINRTGTRMVFTWKVTGTPQIWRQDGAMKFPVQLTGGEDIAAEDA